MGADGGGDVPARGGEPAGGLTAVGILRALLFVTAVLKAAAKPPIVLRTRGSAGGDGGVVGAAGVPGAGLAWAAPVTVVGAEVCCGPRCWRRALWAVGVSCRVKY